MSTLPDFSEKGYKVKRELGRNREEGPITYQANIPDRKQRVIIKEYRFAQTDTSSANLKFYEEKIEKLKKLEHPRIPPYLNYFKTPEALYLVREYKPPTLAKKTSFSPEEIKQIAVSVLEILVYLQNSTPAVIHQRIKPENILIDENLDAYLVDFGFVRLWGEETALCSVSAGTPGFIPPEELYNRDLTTASDLYSLGATLICLLTGTPSVEIGNLIDNNYRFNCKALVGQLSPRFISWLEKMVAPNVKERYPNAALALKALKPIPVQSGATGLEILVSAIKGKSPATVLKLATLSVVVLVSTPLLIYWLIIIWHSRPVSQLLETRECQKCNLWNADLEGANLERVNLEDANLQSAKLREAKLRDAKLREAKLRDAKLRDADLTNADLTDADLRDANLKGAGLGGAGLQRANLERSNLVGANLEGANLEGANLERTNLERANLEGANLKSAKINSSTQIAEKWLRVWEIVNLGGEGALLERANLKGANLEGANLKNANLKGATLEGANLKNANLNANFNGANLEGADLEGANLEGAKLEGASLKGVSLKGASLKGAEIHSTTQLPQKWRRVWEIVNGGGQGSDLRGVNLTEAGLEGAKLAGAKLEGANLRNAMLDGANLEGANLRDANLRGANLEGANLRGANLRDAKLDGANLRDVNLREARLEGANLREAKLEGANLREARLAGANLEGANLDGAENANLNGAKLKSAIMPDGTKNQ